MKNRSKGERIREKKLNNSLIPLLKTDQKKLNIFSVQMEDGVFCLGDGLYVKIYEITTGFCSKEQKELLIDKLVLSTILRIRLSSFYKKQAGKTDRYLTVYIMAENYASASEEILKFEAELSKISIEVEMQFKGCMIDDVMGCINWNFNNTMQSFDLGQMLRHKKSIKENIFPQLSNSVHSVGFPELSKRAVCYLGNLNGEVPTQLWNVLMGKEGDFFCALDIQAMTAEETKLFNHYLEKRFNSGADVYGSIPNINISFFISVAGEIENFQNDMELSKKSIYSDGKFELFPCTGYHNEVFTSIAALGLVDYHVMRNTDKANIAKLFL